MSFKLPPLQPDSADALFGPSSDHLPSTGSDLPFQPFSKSERLGQIVDWSSSISYAAEGGVSRASAFKRRNNAADGLGLDGYGDEEASFSLVDGGKASSRGRAAGGQGGQGGSLGNLNRNQAYGRGGRGGAAGTKTGPTGRQGHMNGTANQKNGYGAQRGVQQGGRGGRGYGGRGGWGGRDWNRDQRTREASVQVGDKWALLEEIEFTRLSKLRLEVDTDDIETVSQHGFLYEYDRAYDRVNTKNEKPLQHMERLHYNPTSSDDPILQDLASKDRAKVFATDAVLAQLMCAPRSVYPWDIVLIREGDKLYMDKRDQGPLDYLSVNENASDPPLENPIVDASNTSAFINTPSALSQQATFLNENFAWQVVKENQESRTDFESPNPFYDPEESEPLASCGYRYRKFDLSITEDEEVDLIVRTEVDALLRGSLSGSATSAQPTSGADDEQTYILLKTLFEFDSRAQGSGGAPDWRTKLDSQRGAVVATEMKNNSLKLARWASMGVLAGAGGMKIGYVSRANPRDENRHTILGTQWFKPRDLASQMNVNLANGWGIVRTIVDLCMKQKEGKYVLLKDPNKPVIRLYGVPSGTFEEGEESESDAADEAAADSDY